MGKDMIKQQLDMLIRENSPEKMERIDFLGMSIIEDLELDSVRLMQLVAGIEEMFSVNLDASESMLELLDDYDELLAYLLRSVEKQMNKKQKEIVRNAYSVVPLYVRNCEEKGIFIEQILEQEQWECIPVLERKHIISRETELITPWAIPLLMENKLISERTSGSTGKYMEIYWKKEDYKKAMLPLWYYRRKYYGINPEDRLCYFYTIHNLGKEMDCFQQKNELGFSKMNLTMEKLRNIYLQMQEFAPKWLLLQPSIAILLCRCMDAYGLPKLESVEYIEFSGEILTKEIRKTVQEHFSCKIADQYGANEFQSIAYECPYGNMHVMTENVYLEVLDNNGEDAGEKEGEVYVTSLTNSVMPLIRYRIGDRGRLFREKTCQCGMHGTVFELASGRMNDWIIGEDGEKITPNVLVRAFDCVNYQLDGVIHQFQAVQEEIGKISIWLALEEVDEYFNGEIAEVFLQSLEDERLKNMEYEFHYQEELFPDEITGKLKWFECKVKKTCIQEHKKESMEKFL